MLHQLALFAPGTPPAAPDTMPPETLRPPGTAEDLSEVSSGLPDFSDAESIDPDNADEGAEDPTEREPFLLTDSTPDLLDEVRQRQEFIDLRWWPDGDMRAPLEAFAAPGRAPDVLATLRHRGVPDADIRGALQANWKANGATEAKRIADDVATGWYARHAVSLLTDIAPAFTDPPDPVAYWDRATYRPRGHSGEVRRVIEGAHKHWETYRLYARALGRIPEPPPQWIAALAQLLPVLEAFEVQHPRPPAAKERKGRKAKTASPTLYAYLVSWGPAARWVSAVGPEDAARAATAAGFVGHGNWMIVRRLQAGALSTDHACPVVAIVPVGDGTAVRPPSHDP